MPTGLIPPPRPTGNVRHSTPRAAASPTPVIATDTKLGASVPTAVTSPTG